MKYGEDIIYSLFTSHFSLLTYYLYELTLPVFYSPPVL